MLVLTVLLIRSELLLDWFCCLFIRATIEESGLGIEEESGVEEVSELVCFTKEEAIGIISVGLASLLDRNEYNNKS